jgi:hypothetical protein
MSVEAYSAVTVHKNEVVDRGRGATQKRANRFFWCRTLLHLSSESKWWLAAAAIFAFCVGPTFISYKPYLFTFDDSTYLQQSIAVSRAFWSGNLHGLGAMVGVRPPAMTLLGLPWGSIKSWDAVGNCFITLAAVISLLSALCLYLLLRSGVKPLFLAAASVCVFASLGPYPVSRFSIDFAEKGAGAHLCATGFLADSLFAWTTLAALLLIPYEAKTYCGSIRGSIVRGVLWASILSLGAMTKLNFLYFIVLTVPALFFIRLHHGGRRSALAALGAFACWSAPFIFYLVRWGKPAFDNLKASSFGGVATFYYIPVSQFLRNNIREAPGLALSFVLMAIALIYLVIKRQIMRWKLAFLTFLIMVGFAIIVLAAPNRQIRYAFPAIVALPFLTALLNSDQDESGISFRTAAVAAGFVFFGLFGASVPMRHRPDRQSLSRADAVLVEAAKCYARHIELATDSPTLNQALMGVAVEISASSVPTKSVRVDTLAYQAMSGVPIEEDFQAISEADQVVFQARDKLRPRFTNQRVSEYEHYIRKGGYVPIEVGDDLTVYSLHCRP